MIALDTSISDNGPYDLSDFGLRDSKFAHLNDNKLPDERPTRYQRTNLKEVARFFASHHDEHELMYLAGALEGWAYKKREASK